MFSKRARTRNVRVGESGSRMATIEERISRIEGAYDHLATKADLHALEARLIRWIIGATLSVAAIAAALAVAGARLIGS